jgi:Holliday junction DNA helicase RuvA|tara:strand:- start:2637 stop:3236 length:600 start_codon:yes stop_codon:yes gene_type:complete
LIHHLRGILTEKSPTHAVIDVGGVGYGLSISLNTFDSLAVAGSTVSLHTHTYVREDRLQLFGFSDPAEREMFELLISVSGIGPNSAQTILSGLSVADLQKAIHRDQVNELTKIRGVGTKTAQRVVVELRDKIRLPVATADDGEVSPRVSDDPLGEEAAMALEALGFAASAARKAVATARKKHGAESTLQDLIKGALRER